MTKLATLSLLALSLTSITTTARADIDTAAGPGNFSVSPGTAGVPESLFQSGRRPDARLGWYVAPQSGFTSLAGSRAYTFGLRGALVVNRTWGFGLAGNLLGNDATHIGEHHARNFGGYGGVYYQYVFRSNSVVHGYADVTAGGGGWCPSITDERDDCKSATSFAFLEPTLNLELNIVQNVRFAAGIGYRAALAEDGGGLTSRQLSGVVARTSIVVGMF